MEAIRIWNPVEAEFVFSVPGRVSLTAQADLSARSPCSFCPGGAEWDPETVRDTPSRHPMAAPLRHGEELFNRHYVFVYTNEHGRRLGRVTPAEMVRVLELVAARTAELLAHPQVRSVYAFESVGDHFGPTVAHSHGQILGLDFVPRRLTLDARPCPLCRRHSTDDGLIRELALTRAEVPPWSRLPFETVVAPRRHVGALGDLTRDELAELAGQTQDCLRACEDDEGNMPPYLLNIMQAPAEPPHDHHLRLEIVPLHKPDGRLKRPGAMEIGLGVYINPVRPEVAAKIMRDRLPQ